MSYRWEDFNEAADDARREHDRDLSDWLEARDDAATERFRERSSSLFRGPDPRPAKREKLTWRQWAVLREEMGDPVSQLSGERADSLHHLVPRSLGGDDCKENLMWVTGDGTRGEHGRIEARDPKTLEQVRVSLRPEQYEYCLRTIGEDRLRRLYPLLSERRAA